MTNLRSARAIDNREEGGWVRPSHGHGRYGVVPPKEPDIIAISVLLIPLPHHTTGRRRLPSNAVSIGEQGDDNSGSEPSRCVRSWQRTL